MPKNSTYMACALIVVLFTLCVMLYYTKWYVPAKKGKRSFKGELKKGDKGVNVMRLQMALNSYRDYRIRYGYGADTYPAKKLTLDARFGNKTLDALLKCTGEQSIDYSKLKDIETISKS